MDQTNALRQTFAFAHAEVTGMSYPSLNSDHVHQHRLWACTCTESELSPLEEFHIRACETCMDTMRLCLRAPTFGAVLRELNKSAEE